MTGWDKKRQRRIRRGLPIETSSEICWRYHPKECVVCGEHLAVSVHHYNGHHWDDRPENLVPLCPTHHQYWHSRHQHLIKEKVDDYVKKFIDDCAELIIEDV